MSGIPDGDGLAVAAMPDGEYDAWASRCGVIPISEIRARIAAKRTSTGPKIEDE